VVKGIERFGSELPTDLFRELQVLKTSQIRAPETWEAREHGTFLDDLRPLEMMSKDDKNDGRNPTECAKAVATEAGISNWSYFGKQPH
jgi:hypothetical protein